MKYRDDVVMEGGAARHNKLSWADNPYTVGTNAYQNWIYGWLKAKSDPHPSIKEYTWKGGHCHCDWAGFAIASDVECVVSTGPRGGHAASVADRGVVGTFGEYSHAVSFGVYSTVVAIGTSSISWAGGEDSTAVGDVNCRVCATGLGGSAIAVGVNSHVLAGENGALVAAWYDHAAKRKRYVVGYVGEDGILPNTWYDAVQGKLVVSARQYVISN